MIYTLGYTGLEPTQLIKAVEYYDAYLLDIRLSPTSRVAHWRKPALQQIIGDRYQHIPDLGNENYRTGGPITLRNPVGALPVVQQYLTERPVILLCACADATTCHRRVAALWLADKLHVSVTHLHHRKKECGRTKIKQQLTHQIDDDGDLLKPGEYIIPSNAIVTTCHSCGADITWIRTSNGKAMPLSLAMARMLPTQQRVATSHFADCPHGKEWKKT